MCVYIAPYYQYYAANASMTANPLITHTYPNGGATSMLADTLEAKKRAGIAGVADRCDVERGQKRFPKRLGCPCEKV